MKPIFWIYIILLILAVLAMKYLSPWWILVAMVMFCCVEIVTNLENRD